MDMEILLALQTFRDGCGKFLPECMSRITYLGDLNVVLILMALIYWCVHKEIGVYLMMGWSGNRLANGLMKVTVCAYRPWIKDARIIPYGNATAEATGYSFPSGHTMNAVTVYGGAAMRGEIKRPWRIVLWALVALVGFSRLFLGVHTPQDVLAGALAGALVMALTCALMRRIAAHPEMDLTVVCVGIALAAAIAVYAALKPYPEDYNAEGKLIVDGTKMANDTFKGVGWCAAFLTGWLLERRFVGFSTKVPLSVRLLRAVIGLGVYLAMTNLLLPLIKTAVPGPAGTVLSCFLQMFYVAFLFPWAANTAEKRFFPDEKGTGAQKCGA